jgi:hypothetical protein
MTLYEIRSRLDDGVSWERIGHPCPELSTCKADAERFTEHYACVEVINLTTGRVVHRATRRPIN